VVKKQLELEKPEKPPEKPEIKNSEIEDVNPENSEYEKM